MPTSTVRAGGADRVDTATRDGHPAQWALVQHIRTVIDGATVQLRERILAWTRDRQAPKLTLITVLVITKVGPMTVRREFHVPPVAPDASVRTEEDELMKA